MWQKDTKSTEVVANLSCALEDTNHDLAAFAASICPSPQQTRGSDPVNHRVQTVFHILSWVDPGSSSINRFPMHLLVLNRGFQESPMVQWSNGMETVSIFAWPMRTKTIWDLRELCIKNDEGRLSTQLLEMGKQGRSATAGPKISQNWFSAGKKDSLHELMLPIVTEECTKQVGRSLDAEACILTKDEPCGLRLPTFVKGIKYRTVINSRF